MFGWLRRRKQPAKQQLDWNSPTSFVRENDGFIRRIASAQVPPGSAVWACICRIAHRAAQAKFRVVDADGSIVGHPVDILLASPSGRLGRFSFQRSIAESLLTNGNGYALTVMGGTGLAASYPTGLRYVPADSVSIIGMTRLGRQSYRYSIRTPTPGFQGTSRNVPSTRIVHAKGPFYDPASGKSASPLQAAAASIGLYLQSVASSQAFLSNSSRFGGVLETNLGGSMDSPEDEKAIEQYREMLREAFAGTANTGKIVQLPHGHTLKAAPSLAKEMLAAEQLNWSVNEIARHYGVPLALIQHTNGVRQSTEELETALVQEAVAPLCAQMSDAYTERILTESDRMAGYRVEADLSAFGLPTASGKASRAMTLAQTGVVTINEIRRGLGLPPIDDGDRYPDAAGAPERDRMDTDGSSEEEDQQAGEGESEDQPENEEQEGSGT